jgi:hypothetical protein
VPLRPVQLRAMTASVATTSGLVVVAVLVTALEGVEFVF